MVTDIQGACIGIGDLARQIGLSRRTIHRILARGELPTIRIGRRRLIRLAEVRQWLAGCETPTPGANVTGIGRQFVDRAAMR